MSFNIESLSTTLNLQLYNVLSLFYLHLLFKEVIFELLLRLSFVVARPGTYTTCFSFKSHYGLMKGSTLYTVVLETLKDSAVTREIFCYRITDI